VASSTAAFVFCFTQFFHFALQQPVGLKGNRLQKRLAGSYFASILQFRQAASAFTRFRSALVTPSRMPVSNSRLRTHSFNVSGTHLILGGMDSMAAHMEEHSPLCSSTCAPRAHVGENLFDFFMTPFSQTLGLLKTQVIHTSNKVRSRTDSGVMCVQDNAWTVN
jgi:hypothetical protein